MTINLSQHMTTRGKQNLPSRWVAARFIILFLLIEILGAWSLQAQETPGWFPKPPLLPAPSGPVVTATNGDQIVAAAEGLAEGATLMIAPGAYELPRTIVLRDKKNITIRSASGEPGSVTLSRRGWTAGTDRDDALHIGKCEGVTIAGLTFSECRSYGIKLDSENSPRDIHILRCNFRNIGMRAIKGTAGKDPEIRAVKGSVRFCEFQNTRVPPAEWLFDGDYISAIDMMALDNWTFSDNIFRNINGRNGGGRAAIFIWVRSRNVVVERNLIFNCDRGISFGNPGQSTANIDGNSPAYVTDGIICNNCLVGGADCGIELWHSTGIKVFHNSIWRPERNFSRGIRVGAGTRLTEIVNNLIHGGIAMDGGEAEARSNFTGLLENAFVEPSTGNLNLTASATKAIDQGVALVGVRRDLRGQPRKGRPDLGAFEFAGEEQAAWVEPMKKVHAKFSGTPGTFAQIGDSITYSGAFWTALGNKPTNMDRKTDAAYQLAMKRLQPGSLNQKGPDFGNQGSMTIRWARENIANWLAKSNPETAVIMFGSNDVRQMEVDEYEKTTLEVVAACLANGTVVLLTTAPPQTALLAKCEEFAEAIRRIANEVRVPLIDYHQEILTRRPTDWDGSGAGFENMEGDTYNVATLISRDGVHPSYPKKFESDFSHVSINNNGYGLRNWLTLMKYAEVIERALEKK